MRAIIDYLAVFANIVKITLTTPAPQRWRRLRFGLLWVLVFPVAMPLAHLFMALDHVFYPGFRKTRIERPLFVIGNMRTGSTWLQRLLARDADHITGIRTIDMFMPSVIQQRFMAMTARIDAALGGHGMRALLWIDERIFKDFQDIHPMGLLKPEEDEFLLLLSMHSATLAECFPGVPRLRRYLFPDDDLPPAELDRALTQYREQMRRLLYARRGPTQLLSKNPKFSGKVAAIRRIFPDARFIYLIRDPRKAVASTASLMHFVWRETGALPPDGLDPDFVIDMCRHHMRDPLMRLADLPLNQLAIVRYEDMARDIEGTVKAAFSQLGLSVSDALDSLLTAEERRTGGSRHRYSLEDWGLDEATLIEELGDIFRAFGYLDDEIDRLTWPVAHSHAMSVPASPLA